MTPAERPRDPARKRGDLEDQLNFKIFGNGGERFVVRFHIEQRGFILE